MPVNLEEWASLAATYQVALGLIAAKAFTEVLLLWRRVSMDDLANSTAAFAKAVLPAIRTRRRAARRLAITFTRLERAVMAGVTYPDPDDPNPPGQHQLSQLRREFEELVRELAPGALVSNVIPDKNPLDDVDDGHAIEPANGDKYRPYKADDWTADRTVVSEMIDKLDEYLEELDSSQDAEAEALIRAHAIVKLTSTIEQIDAEESEQVKKKVKNAKRKAKKKRKDAKDAAGVRVAAHADRMVQNGGRHAAYVKGHLDDKVIGFARIHHPEGDAIPCGFCGMLLSRQVFYKTRKRAGGLRPENPDGSLGHSPDEYHNGDHCSAIEVYSRDQYNDSDMFTMNREMLRLWNTYIKNKFSGDEALSQFRSLLRRLKADRESAQPIEPQEGNPND